MNNKKKFLQIKIMEFNHTGLILKKTNNNHNKKILKKFSDYYN